MLDVSRDTAAFMQDLAVQVVKPATTDDPELVIKGILTQPNRDLNFGGVDVSSTDPRLIYATKDLVATEGMVLVVDGARYVVRGPVDTAANRAFSIAKLRRVL